MSELKEIADKKAALEAQLAELQKQEDELKAKEKAAAITRINEDILQFGISPSEIKFPISARSSKPSKSTKTQSGAPKYRDPDTGQTWTGKGRTPEWVKNAESREAFLIK